MSLRLRWRMGGSMGADPARRCRCRGRRCSSCRRCRKRHRNIPLRPAFRATGACTFKSGSVHINGRHGVTQLRQLDPKLLGRGGFALHEVCGDHRVGVVLGEDCARQGIIHSARSLGDFLLQLEEQGHRFKGCEREGRHRVLSIKNSQRTLLCCRCLPWRSDRRMGRSESENVFVGI